MPRRASAASSKRSTHVRKPRRPSPSFFGAFFAFLAAMAIAAAGARGEVPTAGDSAVVGSQGETAVAVNLVPGTNPPVAYATDGTGEIVWMARWNPATRTFEAQDSVCRHSGEMPRDDRGDLAQHFRFK